MLKIIYIFLFLKCILCSNLNKSESLNTIIGGDLIRFNNGNRELFL